MSYWGMGPRLGAGTGVYFGLMLVWDRAASPAWQIVWLPGAIAWSVGLALILLGIALYLHTARQLLTSLRHNQLLTAGPFRVVRHPLYAIGLWLLCPGFCLLFRSYLIMTTPLCMAILVWLAIRREERTLVAVFGQAYRNYQQNTPAIIPSLQ